MSRLDEIADNDVLSVNDWTVRCQQCKQCTFNDGGTPFSDSYDKASCEIYEYPDVKPEDVIRGGFSCEYFMEDE